jgi:hypothetical protein
MAVGHTPRHSLVTQWVCNDWCTALCDPIGFLNRGYTILRLEVQLDRKTHQYLFSATNKSAVHLGPDTGLSTQNFRPWKICGRQKKIERALTRCVVVIHRTVFALYNSADFYFFYSFDVFLFVCFKS